jgi:hypothetical protein
VRPRRASHRRGPKTNFKTLADLHGEAPFWVSDPGHAWLAVRLPLVLASGFKPSTFSYRFGGMAFLEEDCDAGEYLYHVKLWDGIDGASLPDFPSEYVEHFSRNAAGFDGIGAEYPGPAARARRDEYEAEHALDVCRHDVVRQTCATCTAR